MNRLDLKSVRFDRLNDSVFFNAKKGCVEISREALQSLARKELDEERAIYFAVAQAKRLNRLINIVPADDGKINITKNLLLNDGQFGQTEELNHQEGA